MPAEKAQEIARGLKWLAQSYAEAGMVRERHQGGARQPVVAQLLDLHGAQPAARSRLMAEEFLAWMEQPPSGRFERIHFILVAAAPERPGA